MKKKVVNAIDRWVKNYPNPNLDNFSNEISIKNIQKAFHNNFYLNTQFRSESNGSYVAALGFKEKLFKNSLQSERKPIKGRFIKEIQNILDSSSVKERTCKNCNGNSINQCNVCKGHRRTFCKNCSGSGEKSCDSCSGVGYII